LHRGALNYTSNETAAQETEVEGLIGAAVGTLRSVVKNMANSSIIYRSELEKGGEEI